MLNEHTLDQLRSLRLDGMVAAPSSEQATSTAAAALGFDERLSAARAARDRLARRQARGPAAQGRQAQGQQRLHRGHQLARQLARLDRHLVTTLAGGDWLRHAQNVLITGATGSGKTWLACALAHQAARCGFSVLYARAARLLEELHVAHGDGSFARRLAQLAALDVLVIDDFADRPDGAGRAQRPARAARRPRGHDARP